MAKIFGISFGKKTKQPAAPPSAQTEADAEIEDLGWGEEDSPSPTKKRARKKRSMKNVLYPVLLLTALGAAAFFYFSNQQTEEPAPAEAPVASSTKILPLPVKKTSESAAPEIVKENTPVPEASAPAAPAVPKDTPRLVEALPAPVSPPVPAPVEEPRKLEVPAESGVSAKKPEPQPVGAAKTGTSKPQPSADTQGGDFVIRAGVMVQPESIKAASAKIKKLGFDPVLIPMKKTLTVLRLKVGEYSRVDAEAKIRELYVVAPDAFTLKGSDGKVIVYAASHVNKEMSQAKAHALESVGVPVEEEEATRSLDMTLVQFGSFSNITSAEKFAAEARAMGLEAAVTKKNGK